MRVAIGLRPHSGWAAAVTVGGGPRVLDRRRLLLTDRPLPAQPFHQAAGLEPAAAAALVEEAARTAAAAARTSTARLLDELAAGGHQVAAVGVVAGSGSIREDLPLGALLAAHARLHAAEGELYRDVLLDAAAGRDLPVTLLAPREAEAAGRRLLGRDAAGLRALLIEVGRPLGPPWTRDHKDATVAALLALEAAAQSSRSAGSSSLPARSEKASW